jgi:hypothetical protein
MAVMTHAHIPQLTLPVAANYRAYSEAVQDEFDRHLQDADKAANDAAYFVAMIRAAQTLGIAIPAGFDIARCDCFNNGCGCDLVFDAHTEGAVVTATNGPDCNLSQLQCPDCGHDHPRPITD